MQRCDGLDHLLEHVEVHRQHSRIGGAKRVPLTPVFNAAAISFHGEPVPVIMDAIVEEARHPGKTPQMLQRRHLIVDVEQDAPVMHGRRCVQYLQCNMKVDAALCQSVDRCPSTRPTRLVPLLSHGAAEHFPERPLR
jgi:hypothetical protein